MARLTLNLASQTLATLELHEGISYSLGRAKDSDLVIPEEAGISRRHIELEPQGNTWKLKLVARYGEIYLNSVKVTEIQLNQNLSFEMPPYRFDFQTSFPQEENVAVSSELENRSHYTNEPTQILSLETPMTELESRAASVGANSNGSAGAAPSSLFSQSNSTLQPGHEPTLILNTNPSADLENTSIAPISLMGVLKLFNDKGNVIRIYRLEGEDWTAGRSEDCSIFLENSKVSRKQFDLRRSTNTFLIRNLSTSNATSLNADPLPNDQWMPIASGDLIQVLDLSLQFDVVNPATFNEEEVMRAPVEESFFARPTRLIRSEKKPLYIRIAAVAVILIGLGFAFLSNDDNAAKPAESKKSNNAGDIAYAKLTPAQQDYVRDSYMAAERLYNPVTTRWPSKK